jgi:hypothetical protein
MSDRPPLRLAEEREDAADPLDDRVGRALQARRGAGEPTAAEREILWLGVERGLARERRRAASRRFGLVVSAAGVAAAAAAALFVLQRHEPVLASAGRAPAATTAVEGAAPSSLAAADPAPADLAAANALAQAEEQSREASRALEAEVAARMAALGEGEARGLERALAPARARLESARLLALQQDDLTARLRVLSNEARYLRSLSRALRSAEEATP